MFENPGGDTAHCPPLPTPMGECSFILGDQYFVELLKTVRNFNRKTNDASVNQIDYKF